MGDVTAFRQPESQKGTLAGVTGGWWPGLLLTHLTSSVSFYLPAVVAHAAGPILGRGISAGRVHMGQY